MAVYPGTFDPITKGHIDVIKRGAEIFDSLTILVAIHKEKHTLFSINERLEMVKCAIKEFTNVEVTTLNELLIDYLKNNNVKFVLRGLRAVSDFDYELQMALTNSALYPNIETIFIMSSSKYIFLSSSIVREIASYGGNVSNFVPQCVSEKLTQKKGG
ncbi:MAG: pantetheine-phosphate adenylyltransferase [Nitrospiraceae bacterium]|nr:pantetheine-phosphate adenylyltransferase [Nitrospiraceae bacterium]